MEHKQYIYRKRAVAFLDVLGFRQKLYDFDNEAKGFHSHALASEDQDAQYISAKANDFINTFKKALGKLDKGKYRWYLFSDFKFNSGDGCIKDIY